MSIEATIKSLRRQLRDLDQQRAKVMHALAALEALAGAASENGDARKRDSPLVDAALAALRAATKPMGETQIRITAPPNAEVAEPG